MSVRLINIPVGRHKRGALVGRGTIAGTCNLPFQGNRSAPILVVVDPIVYQEFAPESRLPMTKRIMDKLGPYMKNAGFSGNDVVFLSACKPIDEDTWKSDSKLNKAIKNDHNEFKIAVNQLRPRLIIAQGKAAIRQVLNRPAKITKLRGVPFYEESVRSIVMPTLGIAHVLRVPEHAELFEADLRTAAGIVRRDFKLDQEKIKTDYKWCFDLTPVLARKPKLVAIDIEATAYEKDPFPFYYSKNTRVMTIQLTIRAGETFIVPIDYPGMPNPNREKCLAQLRQLLGDKSVRVVNQNLKYDLMTLLHVLNIKIANYSDDILLMVHMLNENMLSKSLDDICRVYLPLMGGYKDEFYRKGHNMARMDLVPPEDMSAYGGADSDAVFQLLPILEQKLKADPKLYNCYQKVVMPALRAFCEIEPRGFKINREALRNLYITIAKKQKYEEEKLFKIIPESIKAEFRDTGVGLKLSRETLLRAYLFTHPDGLKLKPRIFTKSKLASTSTKLHLPYFIGKCKKTVRMRNPDTGIVETKECDVVADLIAFIKNEKMRTTYVGQDEHIDPETGKKVEKTGFWQYIYNGYIRPSYLLHATVTGRSASRDPNGQNFPKRGEFAKAYRAIFEAPPGWTLLEADYSQLELRIAGIFSKEPTFLRIYQEGGDIHCMTAAVVMGITLDQFMALKKSDPELFALQRYRAKAVNFGFIYGMGWRKFMVYAKTDYGIDYTEKEAENIRKAYFGKYRAIHSWHEAVKDFVRKHKYVRCIDGRVRHLPAVVVDDDGVASSAERQAVNSPVQGSGSDFGLIALARINAELPRDLVRVIGFIHDAIVCIAREGREMEAARAVKHYMETNPLKEWFGFDPPIPIIADVSIGKNLAKMIELEKAWLKDEKLVSFKQVKALHDAELAKKQKPKPSSLRIIKLPQRKAA